MKALFVKHSAYFFTMIAYFVIGGALYLFIDKGDLVLYFSDHRSGTLNEFFLFVNQFGEEWTFVIGFFILLLFVKIRYALFIPLVAISTAGWSLLLKKFFSHLRPKLWFEQQDILLNYVPNIHINSGLTSFPSGHTFAAFAIFGYFALVAKQPILKIFFSICAIFGGLARVYLSQHFLEDILFGGFLGVTVAVSVFLMQKRLKDNSEKWWNKGLVEVLF